MQWFTCLFVFLPLKDHENLDVLKPWQVVHLKGEAKGGSINVMTLKTLEVA